MLRKLLVLTFALLLLTLAFAPTAKAAAPCKGVVVCSGPGWSCASWSSFYPCDDPYTRDGVTYTQTERFRTCFSPTGQHCNDYQPGPEQIAD